MSPKYCSLALDEVKEEALPHELEVHDTFEPELNRLVLKGYMTQGYPFLRVIESQNQEIPVKVKGKIIISF